jgi:hypothetical protein
MHICYADIWAIRRDRRTKCADIFVVRSSMVSKRKFKFQLVPIGIFANFQNKFLFEFQLDFFVSDSADSSKVVLPKP